MIRYSFIAFVVALVTLSVIGTASAEVPPPATTISSGGLPHSLRLTGVDDDAFRRRIDLPPLLDEAPEVSGPSYTVTSGYWDSAVRNGNGGEAKVDTVATYYASSGLVRTKQGSADVWLGLDLRQRAILDRYVRLAGLLSDAPSSIEVLRTAGATETIGINIGAIELTAEQRGRFWTAVQTLRNQPGIVPGTNPNPVADPNATWVIFTLPEGRAIQMRYSPANNTLSEAFGKEEYLVPSSWLVPIVGAEAAPGANPGIAPLQVPQESSTGSPVWWLIMVGGGLLCIGAAVWLQRNWAQRGS